MYGNFNFYPTNFNKRVSALYCILVELETLILDQVTLI